MTPTAPVPGHICNMLCESELHVDLVWSEPSADESVIAWNFGYVYPVTVDMVRLVEAMPPGPLPEGQSIVQITGHKLMSDWESIKTWGVWWRPKPEPEPRPWAMRARVPGGCARTGRAFRAGARIVKGDNGWESV